MGVGEEGQRAWGRAEGGCGRALQRSRLGYEGARARLPKAKSMGK
jgi:hypothetical protein